MSIICKILANLGIKEIFDGLHWANKPCIQKILSACTEKGNLLEVPGCFITKLEVENWFGSGVLHLDGSRLCSESRYFQEGLKNWERGKIDSMIYFISNPLVKVFTNVIFQTLNVDYMEKTFVVRKPSMPARERLARNTTALRANNQLNFILGHPKTKKIIKGCDGTSSWYEYSSSKGESQSRHHDVLMKQCVDDPFCP